MFTLEEKKKVVEEVVEQVKKTSGIYLADITGINVESITAFRAELREKGIFMRVVKNTLLKNVFEKCKVTGLDEYLVGQTSLILATENDP
ncbi:MAG: 50S ribosomal protein L10, partial [Fibrobacteria bacterium]|nr:50S ribosomal protein L10 [Fibrobacteria bacterium]